MNIYRVNFFTADEGLVVAWTATADGAERKRKELQRDYGDSHGVNSIEKINFPIDKAGILEWLNANLTRDNG